MSLSLFDLFVVRVAVLTVVDHHGIEPSTSKVSTLQSQGLDGIGAAGTTRGPIRPTTVPCLRNPHLRQVCRQAFLIV